MKLLLGVLLLFGFSAGAAECTRCARLQTMLNAGDADDIGGYLSSFHFSKNGEVAQQEANLIMKIMAKYRKKDNTGLLGEMWYSLYLDTYGRSFMTNALENQISADDRQALRRLYKQIGQTWLRGNG